MTQLETGLKENQTIKYLGISMTRKTDCIETFAYLKDENKNIKLHNSEIKTIDNTKYVIINNKDDNYISIEGTITKDGFVTLNESIDFYVLTEVYINNKRLEGYGRNKMRFQN